VIALYARGLTVREIQAFLREMYGVEVSPDLISAVTDAVVAEVTAWQARPLESMYPVVFFDALRVKIRDEAVVRSKAVYLALAVLPDGSREVLGIWIEQTEGAKFWMKVFTDLRPSIPRRRCRRVSSTCSATVWTLRIGKSGSRWRRPFARSTPRRAPTRRSWCSMTLNAARGACGFQRSWPLGAARGRTSFRSLRSHPRSDG